ncbi:MAG TPA: hypothetical protein VHR66_09470 [Gemmataceae bacterium]|jgi:hypothetical protein|nr:hypothetical protein [Gemmataceae bacterium]
MARNTVLLLAIVLTFPATAEEKPAVRTISSSGHSVAGEGKAAYGVSGTSLMSRDGRPIACYGVVKEKGQDERYAYFVVFKSPATVEKPAEFLLGGSSELGSAVEVNDSGTVVLGSRKCALKYKLSANGNLTKIKTESLTIDGKDYPLGEARVFLVNLTVEKPTCQALKVEPPKLAPDLGQKQDALKIVEDAVEDLQKRSNEVREFLEPAKK